MESIAPYFLSAGKAAFCLAGLIAGVHTLRSHRANPGSGTHLIAAWAIALGSAGMLLFPLAPAVGNPELERLLWVTGESLLRGGFLLLACFVWRVFRPASFVAGAAVAACAAALGATFVWEMESQTALSAYDAGVASAWAAQYSFALPLVWAAGEAGNEWLRARRRVVLGLAEPFAAWVFLLWGICTGCLVAVCLLANAIAWAEADGRLALAAGLTLLRGLLYLPSLVAVWIGFFPPAWLRRRSRAPEASS